MCLTGAPHGSPRRPKEIKKTLELGSVLPPQGEARSHLQNPSAPPLLVPQELASLLGRKHPEPSPHVAPTGQAFRPCSSFLEGSLGEPTPPPPVADPLKDGWRPQNHDSGASLWARVSKAQKEVQGCLSLCIFIIYFFIETEVIKAI